MSRFVTSLTSLSVALLTLAPLATLAEDGPNPCPAGTVASGSGDVMVEGKQAARAGDAAGCAGPIIEGSPDVFINGKPFKATRPVAAGRSSPAPPACSSTASRWRGWAMPRAAAANKPQVQVRLRSPPPALRLEWQNRLPASGSRRRCHLGGFMNFSLSAPRRETFLVSAIIAILVVIGMIEQLPFFTSYALGLLLIAYLVLAAGVRIDCL